MGNWRRKSRPKLSRIKLRQMFVATLPALKKSSNSMHIEHSSGHTQNFSGYSAAHARRHGRVKRMPGEGSLLLPKVGLFEVFQVADGALSGRAFDARRLHRQSWTQGSCQGHGKGKQGSHNMKSDCLVCKNDDMGASAVYSATRSCPFSGGSV